MGRGSGNDGSSLQNQRKLIISVKSEQKLDGTVHDAIIAARMSTCAYSGEPLREPIVCDEYGTLYNKESILTLILQNKLMNTPSTDGTTPTTTTNYSHIKSLKKDIINVHPTLIKENKKLTINSTHGIPKSNPALFLCPLTQLEANGKQPFIVLRKCGCLIAERAYKAICKTTAPSSLSSSSSSSFATSTTTSPVPSSSSSSLSSSSVDHVDTLNNTLSSSLNTVCPVCNTSLATDEEGGPYIKLCPSNDELSVVKLKLHEKSQQTTTTKSGSKKSSTTVTTNGASLLTPMELSSAEPHPLPNDVASSCTVSLGQKRPRSPETSTELLPPPPPPPSLSIGEQQRLLFSLSSHSLPTKHEQIMNNSLTQSINEAVNQRIHEQSTKSSVYSALFHQPTSKNHPITITSSTNTGTISSTNVHQTLPNKPPSK